MGRVTDRLRQVFHRLRGRLIEFDLRPYQRLAAQINEQSERLKGLEDRALRDSSEDLIGRARAGAALDDLLVEAFALVREVSGRVIGLRHFDVQVLGGIAMHQGKLIEMQTGEGKTLVAVLVAYLNGLAGDGVHVLTFNDYLARRDAGWMGPVYEFLGLTVGYVQEGMDKRERQDAYNCDITYATAKEAGFDYLRDHICMKQEDLVHRPFNVAIVDEADSILIDEARIPLVIAGSTEDIAANPYRMAELARELRQGRDYETDENDRNVYLTESGTDSAERALGCGSLHDSENTTLLTQLNLALHAQVLLHRDVDYIVREGKAVVVDEFTGRVVEDRHWPGGLQAAVEAKEGLAIRAEGMIRGSITLIHFMQLYRKTCGMTATAQAAAEEFNEFYDLTVVVIPAHRPCVRADQADLVFASKQAKLQALIGEITSVRATGRPILVGTSSVAESEELAEALRRRHVTCQVLNAKNDEPEAQIVAQAGALRAVTISTNMAGRGTDIRLGGAGQEHHDEVVTLGGLYVIGTNRYESRRVDDQLRGRAGRQGDPGSSRFFISLEDDLLRRFGIDDLAPAECGGAVDPIDDPAVGRDIAHVQRVIEGQNLDIRKTLWKYSCVIEHQRRALQGRRQDLLTRKTEPVLLQERAAQRYRQVVSGLGPEIAAEVERQITLFHIDRCWADYLEHVWHVREGIHWISAGRSSPLDVYHKAVGRDFRQLLGTIDDRAVETFESVSIGADGVDLEQAGVKGPSSTWTYVVGDNPFGDWFERFVKGVVHSRDLLRNLKRVLADSEKT